MTMPMPSRVKAKMDLGKDLVLLSMKPWGEGRGRQVGGRRRKQDTGIRAANGATMTK